nr:hypothetical protein Itr_chr01CG04170 [Ipomoea trifida]
MASSKTVFMLVFLMVILLGSPVVNVMGKSISNDRGDFVNSTGNCDNDADCDKLCKCSPGTNKCSDGLCVCGYQSERSALMSTYGPQVSRA